MQSFFDRTQPLWLPRGSVRALLAIGIAAAYVAGLMPNEGVLMAVVAFYFGQRSTGGAPSPNQVPGDDSA